jgi:hypothetical protein
MQMCNMRFQRVERNPIKKSLAMMAMLTLLAFVGAVACRSEISPESGPTVSGELQSESWQSDWQKASIPSIELLIGQQLPVPTHLPPGCTVKEVYYNQDLNSIPQVTHILLLISDQPVEWVGKQYRCRLALLIGWNQFGGGFKWLQGEPVLTLPGPGVLEEKDIEWVLWWENFSSPAGQSVLQFRASRLFAKDELVKIAASTPTTTPASPSATVPEPAETPAPGASPSPPPTPTPPST